MSKITKIVTSKIAKSPTPSPNISSDKNGFKEILKNFLKGDTALSDIDKIQTQISKGIKFKPEQLLSYQIRAGRLHLKVELASKVAESASGTARRLQSSQ